MVLSRHLLAMNQPPLAVCCLHRAVCAHSPQEPPVYAVDNSEGGPAVRGAVKCVLGVVS